MSVLRKEMDKYRDIDEDELLTKLSEEELKRLEDELEELDPDVSGGDPEEEPQWRNLWRNLDFLLYIFGSCSDTMTAELQSLCGSFWSSSG